MKKICLFATAVALSSMVMAQKPNYGLKAGLNLANLTNTSGDFRAGFHVGGLAHIHFTPQVSIQPEIMYSTQGAKFSGNSRTTLGYINIPVLLQYNFSDGFRLQGGPQLGILTNANTKVGDNTIRTGTNGYNNVEFSIPLGVSYLGKTGLGLDARYNIGVSNVSENSSPSVRNSVIQFGLFYLFNHRHKDQSR